VMNLPAEERLAALWWQSLSDGETALWTGEALAEIGPDDPRRTDELPLACWKLYWSRGPQLHEDELERLSKGDCPICRRRGFVIGPWGGSSINIECAQLDCRMRFNVAFYSGQAVMAHHLGNGATGPSWPSEPGVDG
jgi:hypothetical protein